MKPILNPTEAQLFGQDWQTPPLAPEPDPTEPNRVRHHTVIERTVHPLHTTLRIHRMLETCPDRETHATFSIEQVSPDCLSCDPAADLSTAKTCVFHWQHHNCSPFNEITRTDPRDAVSDDEGNQLQFGYVSSFSHHEPGKLRLGWNASPTDLRNEVNNFLNEFDELTTTAGRMLRSAEMVAWTNSPNPTGAAAKTQDAITKAKAHDRRQPAYNMRHTAIRHRLERHQQDLDEVKKLLETQPQT